MKYIKLKKNYGGGGGGTVESIPAWARPYFEKAGAAAEGAYASGDLGKVVGATKNQNTAFTTGADAIVNAATSGTGSLGDQNKRLTAAANTGGYDTKALKDAAILQSSMGTAKLGQQYGAGGTLGSGRQAVMQGAQNAATAAQFAKIDSDAAQQNFANKMLAEKGIGENVGATSKMVTDATSSLAKLGNEERGINQQEADATWQGLQRYASTIYGNPARQSAAGGK